MQSYYFASFLIFGGVFMYILTLDQSVKKLTYKVGGLYLSRYINNGDIKNGRLAAKVGYPFEIFSESSYAGYLTVDESTNSHLFFWFFIAENNSTSAPLVLWLNGGPGCTSMSMLFTGGGPFKVDSASETLIYNPHSWHQNHNILFIDQPINTGYSFSNTSFFVNTSSEAAIHLHKALLQFLQLFPEYKDSPFFLVGESYAGKYIPSIAMYIHLTNSKDPVNKINLKGIAIGNGITAPHLQSGLPEQAFEAGLIDFELKTKLMKLEENAIQHLQSISNDKEQNADNLSENFCQYQNAQIYYSEELPIKGIQEKTCILKQVHSVAPINLYNFMQDHNMFFFEPFISFITKNETKFCLHTLENIHPTQAELPCDQKLFDHMLTDLFKSYALDLEVVMNNYKVLLYSGQFDLVVGYPTTVNLIYNLNWTGAKDYKLAKRKVWRVDGKIAGYVKSVGNFTEVLVRNAGHMVVQDQPMRAHRLITMFTRDLLL